MKNILITFILLFAVNFAFGQEFESKEIPVNLDTLDYNDQIFKNNPGDLTIYGAANSYESAYLLQETIDLTERLDIYREKKNKQMILGSSLMFIGGIGLWYVAEMKEPLYQDGNDDINDAADNQKKKRRYIAWPSAIIAGSGTIIFIDAFKFNKWTKLELGIANIKLTQALYGNSTYKRKYYTDKESKLKKKSIWKRSNSKYRE